MKIIRLVFDIAWFLVFSFLFSIPFWVIIQIAQQSPPKLYLLLGASLYAALSTEIIKKIIDFFSSTERWTLVREKAENVIQNGNTGKAAALVKKYDYIGLMVMSAFGFAQIAMIIYSQSPHALPKGRYFIHCGVFLSSFIAYFLFREGSTFIGKIIEIFQHGL